MVEHSLFNSNASGQKNNKKGILIVVSDILMSSALVRVVYILLFI